MFKGLENNQAVQFGEVLIINLPQGQYRVDGVEVKVGNNWDGSRFKVPVGSLLEKGHSPGKIITHYTSEEHGDLYKEVYEAFLQENRDQYRNEDCETVWPNLEVEMACRKALQEFYNKGYKPVYDTPETSWTKVDYSIVGTHEDTGSPYITTPLLLGQLNWGHGSGLYRVDASAIAASVWQEVSNKYKDKFKFDNSPHSNVHYCKINGQYLLTESGYSKDNIVLYKTTLEEAQALVKTIDRSVRGKLMSYIAPAKLSDMKAAEVQKGLTSLINSMQEVSPYQKSQGQHRSSIKHAQEMLKDITEYIEGEVLDE